MIYNGCNTRSNKPLNVNITHYNQDKKTCACPTPKLAYKTLVWIIVTSLKQCFRYSRSHTTMLIINIITYKRPQLYTVVLPVNTIVRPLIFVVKQGLYLAYNVSTTCSVFLCFICFVPIIIVCFIDPNCLLRVLFSYTGRWSVFLVIIIYLYFILFVFTFTFCLFIIFVL